MKESEKQHGLSRLETARGMRLWILNGALEAVYTAITPVCIRSAMRFIWVLPAP